jgi:hypothetical protein
MTPREEVLQQIADGCSTSEVASNLFISGKTVKNHLASIYEEAGGPGPDPGRPLAVRIGIDAPALTR